MSSRAVIPTGRQRAIRLRNEEEDIMKRWRLVPAMLFLVAMFVYGLFGDSMPDTRNALAAERQAKDIKVVLYMTDW